MVTHATPFRCANGNSCWRRIEEERGFLQPGSGRVKHSQRRNRARAVVNTRLQGGQIGRHLEMFSSQNAQPPTSFCMSAGSLVLTLETFQAFQKVTLQATGNVGQSCPLDFKVCVPSRPKDNPPMGGHRSGSPKWTSCNPLAGDVPRAPPPHPRAGWSRRGLIPRALDEISPSSGRRLNTNAASGAEI